MQRFNVVLKNGINKSLRGLAIAPVPISLFLIFTSIIVGGGLYSLFEANANWIDGMYWATVVLPTVGFGDYSPHTTLGRAVYEFVSAAGWISTLLMGGAVIDAIRERTINQHFEQTAELDDDLAHLEQQAKEVMDCVARLKTLIDNDHIRAAAKAAHEERQGASYA